MSASPLSPRPVAGLIPAAGRSSRMGHDKLLAEVGGHPMLRRVATALLAGGCRPVVVVCRGADDPRRTAVTDLEVMVVTAPAGDDDGAGMGASIAAGARALPEDVGGIAVCPADMPLLTADDVTALLMAFDGDTLTALSHDGDRGHPVVFPARLVPALRGLSGDDGARALLRGETVRLVPAGPGCRVDVDTPADLAALPQWAP